MKILPHRYSWKCLRTISADSSGETANDQVYANKSQTYAILAARDTNHFQN